MIEELHSGIGTKKLLKSKGLESTSSILHSSPDPFIAKEGKEWEEDRYGSASPSDECHLSEISKQGGSMQAVKEIFQRETELFW